MSTLREPHHPDADVFEADFICDNCGDHDEEALVRHPHILSDDWVCVDCEVKLWRAGMEVE